MQRPWIAEYDVSLPAVEARVRAQFPELAGRPIALLDEGWDNSMFEVEGWLLRFPRRPLARELIERELGVLPWLAPWLPLPVPLPELVGEPDASYPARFFGYRKLEGRTFDRIAPDEASRLELARELGDFVGCLHAIEPSEVLARGALPTDRHCDVESRCGPARTSLDNLARTALAGRVPEYRMLVERFVAHAREHPVQEQRLTHGDLHVRNVLVDERGARVTGVIDWGDNGLADPAMDLGMAQVAFEPEARARFEQAYAARHRAITPAESARARAFGLFTSIHLLAYGVDTGARPLVDECLVAIARLERAR